MLRQTLLDNWQMQKASSCEESLKFVKDCNSMHQWVEAKKGEADELSPVGVTMEKIMEQIAALKVRGRGTVIDWLATIASGGV